MLTPNIPYLLAIAVEKGVCNAIDTLDTEMAEQDMINHYTDCVMAKLSDCFTFVEAEYEDDED